MVGLNNKFEKVFFCLNIKALEKNYLNVQTLVRSISTILVICYNKTLERELRIHDIHVNTLVHDILEGKGNKRKNSKVKKGNDFITMLSLFILNSYLNNL